MSDVETLCHNNYERRRWAEVVDAAETAREAPEQPRKPQESPNRRGVLRTCTLACAMAAGMGATFIGLGIAMLHVPTILVGAVVAGVFLTAGILTEQGGKQ